MTIDDLARVLEVFPTPQHIAALRMAARFWPYSTDDMDATEMRQLLAEMAEFLDSFIDEET